MLRELCRTFNVAHHNQYQDGLHSQLVLWTYTAMLQCVYRSKSDENGHFHHFMRYFTQKARARRLCMLRDLCGTFDIAHHNPYQCSLHNQPVLRVLTEKC